MTSLPAAGQVQVQPQDEALEPNGGSSGHVLMLCTNGSITGWGSNGAGELGSNPSSYVSAPAPVSAGLLASVVKVAVVSQSSFAIVADGTLWAWGDNSNGQLGVGSGTTAIATAMQVPGIAHVVAVAGGFFHTIALCADGSVWSWGRRSGGALGTSSGAAIEYVPKQIPTLTNIRAITSGDQFSMALDASGHIWEWGSGQFGELGIGQPAGSPPQDTPVQIQLNNVRQIDAANVRAAALCTDGTVWNWGQNSGGQLGLNTTAYTSVPAQVGAGLITDAVWVALNTGATIAVRPDGTTYVWGYNDYGDLGIPSPNAALLPVAGPSFTPNTQIFGQGFLFTSIERTGTVKTWGGPPLGYVPVAPTRFGGSAVPTTPSGVCLAVPVADFPACGPLRAYFMNPAATYVAARHGYTVSPAEIGTAGTTTVIDASLPPYNGTVTFDGAYHVRGDVRFTGGTFSLLANTIFNVDAANTIEVQNATLRVQAASLQGSCPEHWNGILLNGQGRLYTESGGGGGKRRAIIRDANTAVTSYTADWTVPNTNEYYLLRTDFINNSTGLYDLVKGTAQPGEGVRACSFRDGYVGIQLNAVDYFPGNVYGGDYSAALFDANTFSNLDNGILGQAGQAHITNNTFSDNYRSAISVYAAPSGTGEIRHNAITVPAAWPADRLANLPSGAVPTSYGIQGEGPQEIVTNTIVGATTDPTTNGVQQIGMDLIGSCSVHNGNVFRYLDQGLNAATDDLSGSVHTIEGNTFENNVAGLTFRPFSTNPFNLAPVSVSLRCNTFSTALPGGTGVWVKAGTVFPTNLGSLNTPNGNRFDGIATLNKRFVYDANGTFNYYRYNSLQEVFAGSNGDQIYNYAGSALTGTALITTIPSTNACGGSTTPGVNARSAATLPFDPAETTASITLGEAHPNPASETVAFAYTLPTSGLPAMLVLRNILGQRVAEQPLPHERTGDVRLSVQNLPTGLYIGTVEVAGQVWVSRKLTVSR